MVATKTELAQSYDDRLVEWTNVDADNGTPYISVPTRTEITVQLMAIGAATTIGLQISLNVDTDSTKVWGAVKLTDASTVLALTTAGQVETALQSGVLVRPIRTAGANTGTVRLKASRVR